MGHDKAWNLSTLEMDGHMALNNPTLSQSRTKSMPFGQRRSKDLSERKLLTGMAQVLSRFPQRHQFYGGDKLKKDDLAWHTREGIWIVAIDLQLFTALSNHTSLLYWESIF